MSAPGWNARRNHPRGDYKVKVTGTKGYVQVEDDNGNIARFDGEVCLGSFYVRGKVILQSQGKEFFTWHGKDFFT